MDEKDKTPEEKALERRLAGHLPTVDIDGQLFYVDLFMGYLRPKDIFSTLGIEFKKIQDDYSILEENFVFTYNPKTYEAETFDFNDIQSIPEHILLVELPAKPKLDPVSYARMCGYDVESFVRTRGIQSHFKINTVPLKKRLLEIQAQQTKKIIRISSKIEPAGKKERKRPKSLNTNF